MDTVWISAIGNILIRADSIVVLESVQDGLLAQCINGRTVRLTDSACSISFQLALLEEIRHASWDDKRSVVIMAAGGR